MLIDESRPPIELHQWRSEPLIPMLTLNVLDFIPGCKLCVEDTEKYYFNVSLEVLRVNTLQLLAAERKQKGFVSNQTRSKRKPDEDGKGGSSGRQGPMHPRKKRSRPNDKGGRADSGSSGHAGRVSS